MSRLTTCALVFATIFTASLSRAAKVFLNPSNQTSNPVSGGGVEATYALINANIAKDTLQAAGMSVVVDQDFTNGPANANSWGADVFVSVHSNASGGHGTETLYVSSGGRVLADHVQNGLLGKLPYASRGLKLRTDLHVLNATDMYACLTEVVFHDCTSASGYQGHPPSESSFLRSADGQQKSGTGIAAGVCTYFSQSCAAAPPPTGRLSGVVYQGGDLANHVAGATVRLNTGQSTTYDGTNVWYFDVPPGTYTITASAAGYVSNSLDRTVTAGTTTWGSVQLTAAPPPDAGNPQPQPPPTPQPISPVDGVDVGGVGAVLSWTRVTDPQSAAVTYDVEVYDGAVTGTPLLSLSEPQAASSPISTTLSMTLSAGSYSWRVRARSVNGSSVWSSAAAFAVPAPIASSSSQPRSSSATGLPQSSGRSSSSGGASASSWSSVASSLSGLASSLWNSSSWGGQASTGGGGSTHEPPDGDEPVTAGCVDARAPAGGSLAGGVWMAGALAMWLRRRRA